MTNRNDGLEDWEYQEKMLAENDRGREPEWRPQRSFGHYWAETGPYLKLFWVEPGEKHPVYTVMSRLPKILNN